MEDFARKLEKMSQQSNNISIVVVTPTFHIFITAHNILIMSVVCSKRYDNVSVSTTFFASSTTIFDSAVYCFYIYNNNFLMNG